MLSQLANGEFSGQREKLITDKICYYLITLEYPGIKRNNMPEIPEISEYL